MITAFSRYTLPQGTQSYYLIKSSQ